MVRDPRPHRSEVKLNVPARPGRIVTPEGERAKIVEGAQSRPELEGLRAAMIQALRIRGLPPTLQILDQLRPVYDVHRYAPQTRLRGSGAAPRIVENYQQVTGTGQLTDLYTCPAGMKCRVSILSASIGSSDIGDSQWTVRLLATLAGTRWALASILVVDNAAVAVPGAGSHAQSVALGRDLILQPGDVATGQVTRFSGTGSMTQTLIFQGLEIPVDEEFIR